MSSCCSSCDSPTLSSSIWREKGFLRFMQSELNALVREVRKSEMNLQPISGVGFANKNPRQVTRSLRVLFLIWKWPDHSRFFYDNRVAFELLWDATLNLCRIRRRHDFQAS